MVGTAVGVGEVSVTTGGVLLVELLENLLASMAVVAVGRTRESAGVAAGSVVENMTSSELATIVKVGVKVGKRVKITTESCEGTDLRKPHDTMNPRVITERTDNRDRDKTLRDFDLFISGCSVLMGCRCMIDLVTTEPDFS